VPSIKTMWLPLIAALSVMFFCFWADPTERTVYAQSQEKVVLKWLGNAGWEIRAGKTVILLDPFLTRREASRSAEWKTNEDAVLRVITEADYIFAGHSHADHIADLPFIAKRFGSKVIGSRTTINLALTAGLDQSHLVSISGGEKLEFADFSVQVIESRHAVLARGRSSERKRVSDEVLKPLNRPIMGADFVEGGCYLYYFTFGNQRVLHQSTANFIPEKLPGLNPDIALLAEGHSYDLASALKTLDPKVILVHHFDQWRAPFSEGMQEENKKRAERFARDIAKVNSQIKVIVPQFLSTYEFK
jgi:L-ascorbate metabolism protein UlaG (beta-lactamase superfamily)